MPALPSRFFATQSPFTIQTVLATGQMFPSDLRAGQVSDLTQAETLLDPALALAFSGEAWLSSVLGGNIEEIRQ